MFLKVFLFVFFKPTFFKKETLKRFYTGAHLREMRGSH